MAGIPIESLKLSVRATNILHRMEIFEVEQLTNTPIEQIADQRNIGIKTITEIRDIVNQIIYGYVDIDELDVPNTDNSKAGERVYSEEQIDELSRHFITELNLPNKAINSLMRIGCNTLDKLALMRQEDIKKLKGLGAKTCEEMLLELKQWLEANMFLSEDNISTEEMEFYKELATQISPIVRIYWKQLRNIVHESGLSDVIESANLGLISDDCISKVLNITEFEPSLKNLFLRFVPNGIIRVVNMEATFSSLDLEFDINIFIRRIFDGTICTVKDEYCYLNRSHAMQYVMENCLDSGDRNKEIILRRIQGENLQTIGDSYGLSRERVRQILVKTVKKFPLMYEDYFQEPYEYFRFSKEEFCNAFPSCEEASYEYLFIKYKKGEESITSDSISGYTGLFYERIKSFLVEESIRRDKQTVSKTDMVYRVLLSNSDRSMSLDEFEKEYYGYIERKGYPRERLVINQRTVNNHLRNAKHIVFDKNNFLRYCEVEPEIIWNTIDFSQYQNLVISAELIYRDYEELMEELDIRDGYELFYVIKSSLEYWDGSFFEINCRRVPVIVMGDGNEERQAIQLLKEISPIDFLGYYESYEERFGVRKESAQGNPVITGGLINYYNEGIYAIDVPAIDERDVIPFTDVLSIKNFWFTDELEKEFKKICIHSSADAFNSAAFKRIGYSLNVGYAYNDKYSSVVNYFDEEIFSANIVDLNNLDRKLVNLSAFGSAVYKKKMTLEFIEVAPKVLMARSEIERAYGITGHDIKILQDWILGCKDKYFNAHSVWDRLKDDGLVEKLQNNEWLCTCIFRQQETVFSLQVAGGIILCKDSNQINLGLTCKWFVEDNGRLSIQNLTNMFNDTFSTRIPINKIAEKLKAYGVWDAFVTDSFDEYIDTLAINTETDMDEDNLFQEEFF
jgi:hypothetical protein